MSRWRIAAALTAPFWFVGCAAVNPAMDDVSRRVDYLRQDVEKLTAQQKELAEEIRRLAAGGTAPASAPGATPAPPEAPAARARVDVQDLSSAPADQYRSAFALMEEGRYAEAERAFAAFVAAYPQSDLADNAQYWIGECLYTEKSFKDARDAFKGVSDHFPFGNKVPDALYKQALCERQLGETEAAAKTLARLREFFPESEAAAKAGALP